MRSLGLTALLLGGLLAAVVPACASTVTYTTSGVFSVGGTSTFTGTGGATLTFASGSGNLSIPPATVSTGTMGTFTATVPNSQSITGSGTFTLTVDQTSPAAGTAGFGSGAFTGKLSTTSIGLHTGQLVITFVQTSVTIDGVDYTLEGLGGAGLASDQLGLGAGGTTLQADITTPEPTFYTLIGIGLAALAMVGIKRRQKQTS